MDEVTVTDMAVGQHLDGVNVTRVLPNVFVNQSHDVQLDRVRFDHLEIDGDLEINSGIINDVDILALNASALRLDTDQLVEGSIVFTQVYLFKIMKTMKYLKFPFNPIQGVQAQNSLTVATINGVKFEDLLTKSTLDDIIMDGTYLPYNWDLTGILF